MDTCRTLIIKHYIPYIYWRLLCDSKAAATACRKYTSNDISKPQTLPGSPPPSSLVWSITLDDTGSAARGLPRPPEWLLLVCGENIKQWSKTKARDGYSLMDQFLKWHLQLYFALQIQPQHLACLQANQKILSLWWISTLHCSAN